MAQVRFLIVALMVVLLALPEAHGNPFIGKKKKLLKTAKIGAGGFGKGGLKGGGLLGGGGLKGGGLKGGGLKGGAGVHTVPFYVQSVPVVQPVIYQPVYQPVYHQQPVFHQPIQSHAPAHSFPQTSGLRDKIVSHITDKVISGGLGGSFLGGGSHSGGFGSSGSSYSSYGDDHLPVSSLRNQGRFSFNSGSSSRPTSLESPPRTGSSHKSVHISSASQFSKPEISFSDPEIFVSYSKVTYPDHVKIFPSTAGNLVDPPSSHQASNSYARPDDYPIVPSQPSIINFNQQRLVPSSPSSLRKNQLSVPTIPSRHTLQRLQPPDVSAEINRPSLILTPPNVGLGSFGLFPPQGSPPKHIPLSQSHHPLPLESTVPSRITPSVNTQSNSILDSKNQHQMGFFTSEVQLLKNAELGFAPPSTMPSLSFLSSREVGPPSPYVASPPGTKQ